MIRNDEYEEGNKRKGRMMMPTMIDDERRRRWKDGLFNVVTRRGAGGDGRSDGTGKQ